MTNDSTTAVTPSPKDSPESAPRTPTFHQLTVRAVNALTPDSAQVTFSLPEELRDAYTFSAGQHLTIKMMIDGEEIRRTYSLTNTQPLNAAELPNELTVGVRRAPEGWMSTRLTDPSIVGERLEVLTPAGRFTPPTFAVEGEHWLLIAAGSGITPILGIARTLLSHSDTANITLLYGNRSLRSIMFLAELDDLKSTYLSRLAVHHVLSREHRNAELFHGRIDAERLQLMIDKGVVPQPISRAFICGPEPMPESLAKLLVDQGVPRDRTHIELFTTAESPRRNISQQQHTEDEPTVATVEVQLRGVRSTVGMFEGERVLDAALRVGLDAPYACTGGVCSTCRAHVSDGRVSMQSNHALTDDEVERGFVLTCQSIPTTETLSVDYDRA